MDSTKITIICFVALVSILTVILGFRFITDHWEDIKALFIAALVLGGTVTVAIGSFKIKSHR